MAKIKAFNLPGSDGEQYQSKNLKGSPYVIYFYPRDDTPGCTTEACDFRDNIARITKAGVQVFGVSPDPIKKHEKFIAKYDLPFVLLSDEDHAFAEKMDVWQLKKFMGRENMGIVRSTFLVGPEGDILAEWRKVKVKGHVDEVLTAIDEHL